MVRSNIETKLFNLLSTDNNETQTVLSQVLSESSDQDLIKIAEIHNLVE